MCDSTPGAEIYNLFNRIVESIQVNLFYQNLIKFKIFSFLTIKKGVNSSFDILFF